ncbi:MAG: response regulator [Abditibacteriales bacterium]|nr:response regulator [Abditibacteriales bacterium]MDW8364242.1 response regulator [Abditibacteriales bacterium]
MPKILVVEDEPENQLAIRVILTVEGFEVVSVEDGRLALQAAQEQQPDLILLDVMMPEINGFEVLAQLRQHETTRGIPVIMLTALAQRADVAKAVEAGVDDYVAKPFEPDDLIERIRKAIGKRHP